MGPPKILLHIQDRDIWTWTLPNSEEILSGLDTVDRDFTKWSEFFQDKFSINETHTEGFYLAELYNIGSNILKFRDDLVTNMVGEAVLIEFEDQLVPCTINSQLHSGVGSKLCEKFPDSPFSIVLKWINGVRAVSLRSKGFDVSHIASKYDGGGHQCAAGFTNDDVFNEILEKYNNGY
jgi:oligoribonuclease NrnB/cAMP/cGMP phosphodiesterase (DHH superfamily)